MSKREVMLIVAIGVLLIFSLLSYNKINDLENKMYALDHMQNQFQSVNSSVQNISSNVEMKMNDFLKEQLWIPEKGYEMINVDIEGDTIDVIIQWSLRDKLHDEKITFLYREESDTEWIELDVSSHSGLNYSLEYTFPLRGNYETQVVATTENGMRSENLLDLRFKEQLDRRINTHAIIHQGGSDHFDVNIDIHNRVDHEFVLGKDEENLKIKSAKAFLYVNGKMIKELNLLKQNQDHHSDRYSESIYYHDYFTLAEVGIDEAENVELQVIVEDGLGLKYETTANSVR